VTTVDTREPDTVEDTAVWQPGDRARLVFDAVLIAVGIGYLVLAVDLGLGATDRPGPGFFPVIAGTLCAGFLTADLVRVAVAVARRGRRAGAGRVPAQVWLILGAIAVYLVLVAFLGHALTAAVVVAILLKVLGDRRWWVIAVIALVAGFGSDLLFTYLLGLRLPLGLLEVGFSAWT
jgi:putative tricarboxylic transport membrane protein